MSAVSVQYDGGKMREADRNSGTILAVFGVTAARWLCYFPFLFSDRGQHIALNSSSKLPVIYYLRIRAANPVTDLRSLLVRQSPGALGPSALKPMTVNDIRHPHLL